MAHPNETRLALRAAYLSGLPLEQAADKAGVSLASARRWKGEASAEGDDWDKFQRASLIVAGGGFDQAMGRVAAAVILRSEAIMENLASAPDVDPIEAAKAIASLADSLGKAQAAAKRLMPETDRYGIAMDVLKQLMEHSMSRKPALANELVELIEGFGEELGKSWGG